MYGAALKLTPQDCAKIPAEEKLEIPKSMQPRIDALVKLVKDAHSKIPTKGVDMEEVDNQMTKFNNAIKLPFGKLIQSCFTKKITQDRAKKQDLKSKALELTKNLPIPNKATANTINHLSRKAKASLGTGCGIL